MILKVVGTRGAFAWDTHKTDRKLIKLIHTNPPARPPAPALIAVSGAAEKLRLPTTTQRAPDIEIPWDLLDHRRATAQDLRVRHPSCRC